MWQFMNTYISFVANSIMICLVKTEAVLSTVKLKHWHPCCHTIQSA